MTTKKSLENKIDAYCLILESPLTIDEKTTEEAVATLNALRLVYQVKYGRRYDRYNDAKGGRVS